MRKKEIIACLLTAVFLIHAGGSALAVQPKNEDYDARPIFLSSALKPNVLVMLDTSTSMQIFSYASAYTSYTAAELDGYFDNTKTYSWNQANVYFQEDAAGTWDGAFLNWACMRRIDTAKHVLTGGRTWPTDSSIVYGTPWKNTRGYSDGFQQDRYYNGINYKNMRIQDDALGYSCPYFIFNHEPVATAGPDQTVAAPSALLDGSGSSDADNDALVYQWSIDAQPLGSTAVFSDETAVSPTLTADLAGKYTVRLAVNDGKAFDASDTDLAVIEFTTSTPIAVPSPPAGNSPPVANAGAFQLVTTGSSVTLDAGSSYDVDADALTYSWSFTTRPAGSTAALSDPAAINPQFTADVEGGYIINLTVNDGTIDSDPDRIVVNAQTKYYIRIKTPSGPTGIIQDAFDDVRFGVEVFNPTYPGTSYKQGGRVLNPIGDTEANIVSSINEQDLLTDPPGGDMDTPLAESLYTAGGYFAQESAVSASIGPQYDGNAYTVSNTWDPFYFSSGFASCLKSFIILVSDGDPTSDGALPASLKTTYGLTGGSSDYLDDVAYWIHTNDMRSSSFGIELDDTQTIDVYTISTFGGGEARLREAAKWGGFEDVNGDGLPEPEAGDPDIIRSEWDKDGDGDPDNYFKAATSSELTNALATALVDIQKRTAAASAVSVLSTTSEGEGVMVQAYFLPAFENPDTGDEVAWVGYLQSLWLDDMGNMREDSNQNSILDTTIDNVVTFSVVAGDTRVNRYLVSPTIDYPDTDSGCGANCNQISMNLLQPVWEAGRVLSDMEAAGDIDNRRIFTFIDKDGDEVVDEPVAAGHAPFDTLGEVVRFDHNNYLNIGPYLGVTDNSGGEWDYLFSDPAVVSPTDYYLRAINLVYFIQGHDISWSSQNGWAGTTDLRSRLVAGASASGTPRSVWLLGDTINSSPVVISAPPDRFGVIYGDPSYEAYYAKYRNRETAVYVGSNDGMLHAFTSWKYNQHSKGFENPFTVPYAPTATDVGSLAGEVIGTELWAYIPQALLPHLKWLADKDYQHVYYVDMTPRIVDAKIFTSDADTSATSLHPGGWGTILICGLNYGGGEITATSDFDYDVSTPDTTRTFKSGYFAMDVTDPRAPTLLAERTYGDLGFTTSVPSVIRVGDEWFAVFGSGPTDYDGTSTNNGHIYVVDLKTGVPYKNGANDWLFDTGNVNAFMGSPAALDYGLNYNVDAVYIPETYESAGIWDGAMHKVTIPWWTSTGKQYGTITPAAADGQYADNPLDATHPWLNSCMVSSTGPITAPPSLSVDRTGNAWVYFGTGRYITDADKVTTDDRFFYGVKDPFFNYTLYQTKDPNVPFKYTTFKTVSSVPGVELMDTDDFMVTETEKVYDAGGNEVYSGGVTTNFYNLITDIRTNYDGWIRSLGASGSGERLLSKPAVLGGIVLAPTFQPNADVCGFGGDSYLYTFYFETGTAYIKPVFANGVLAFTGTSASGDSVSEMQVLDKVSLGKGLAASAGIHLGKEAGAKGLLQKSTGAISSLDVNPAFYLKSNITSWQPVD